MMAEKKYSMANQNALDEMLLGEPRITRDTMFGLAVYKMDGKVFLTLYEDGVGVKLPAARAEELKAMPHVSEFRPFNKSRGKHYIQIKRANPADFQQDHDLFIQAAHYVASRDK